MRAKHLSAVYFAWAIGAIPHEGSAQLGDSCTVSVLNQTARVQPDGAWSIPNVPANMGPVRARLTCVENGITVSGASDLFSITANRMSAIPVVALGGAAKTPASLSLSAPVSALTSQGQSVQVRSVATFSDGSTEDVTGVAAGTIYASTNPAIASVDGAGVVTAHSSGQVLISALHEAILASVEISVLIGGDSDGDGLPDDFELANGLDPNDGADALEDADSDGLATITEYQTGLQPFNPDSDGDGLRDGREVNDLRTNPLLADTDGDGFRDGLEVQTQSDPLDPSSFNVAAALESLQVTPGTFELVFNTVLGEASRKLRVNGRLIDGTEIDLSSRRYGTTYSSSDLRIASFGAEDGRVVAGEEGQATVTAQVGGRSAATQVRVRTFSPIPLSYLPLSGFANGLTLDGNYVYMATGATGLQIVDVSNPLLPRLVGGVDTPGNAWDVRIVGDLAYVADGRAGVVIVDIRRKDSPRILGKAAVAGNAVDLVVAGSFAYVADELGLSVVDVSNPRDPFATGFVEAPDTARGVDVTGNLALVAARRAGLLVIDVSDPEVPRIVGQTATHTDGYSNAADVTVRGRLAYVAEGAEVSLGGTRVLDFTDPENPVSVGASTSDAFALTSLAFERGLIAASDYYFVNAVPIFSEDPTTQGFRGVVDFSGAPSFRDDDGQAVAARDGFVYMAGVDDGLFGFNVTGDSALHIGRYAVFDDVEPDGLAPVVRFLSPVEGQIVKDRQTLSLRADAEDDFRVESVRFTVDGETVFTDYTAPYEYRLLVPRGTRQLVLGALVTDFAGHQGTTERTVDVTANPAPVVELVAPRAGSPVPEGMILPIVARASDDQAVSQVDFLVDGIRQHITLFSPYRFDYLVPLGATELTISAVARDADGASEPSTVVVPVAGDRAPTAVVLSPRDGDQVAEGSSITILAGVTDDIGIRNVDFFADGSRLVTVGGAPFQWTVTAPAAGEMLRIRVVARDTRLHETSSPEIVVTAAPDPLTAIHGRTIDEFGSPVAGARVEAGGAPALSVANGTFTLDGLPTNIGGLSLSASAVVGSFELHGSFEDLIAPLPGGVVEVGDLVLKRDHPPTTVVGRAVDENGDPVPGAAVKVYNSLAILTATTGEDGGFRVFDVPSSDPVLGLTVSLSAVIDGVRWRGVTGGFNVNSGLETDVGDVVLELVEETPDPRTIAVGLVVDRIGLPVAGARVHVYTPFDVFSTVSASDGTFSLSGVPSVDGELFASASVVIDGAIQAGVAQSVAPEAGGTTDLGRIELDIGGGELQAGAFILDLLTRDRWALFVPEPLCRLRSGYEGGR